jgi:hypothetical protein
MKIYTNEDKKYGGELYDILDTKLKVFYDYCNKAGLRAHQYHYAYSAMLKGRAESFYYDHIQGNSYDFNTMIRLTKEHFEVDETRQFYLAEWRETTFQRVINDNPTKTRSDFNYSLKSYGDCNGLYLINNETVLLKTRLYQHAEECQSAV